MKNNPVQITRKKAEKKIEPVQTGDEIFLSEQDAEFLGALAGVLEYPRADWGDRIERSKDLAAAGGGPRSSHLKTFGDIVDEFSLDKAQELYTRTFDLNPVCALEVGYHLFGEDYKRGQFLAQLRESENPYELGQEMQLPDYLPVVLRLLAQTEDPELRAGLVGYCLLPAIKKMKEHLEKKKNPYESVFLCLQGLLQQIAEESIMPNTEVTAARYQNA